MNEFSSALRFEVKNIDEAGYIEGLAAGYGNVDHGGDRILMGAAAKSLQATPSVPMLLYHDMKRPVGRWGKLAETDAGLAVEGKISIKTRDGGEAYELTKDGALSGLSIGYSPTIKRMVGKVRELVEIAVHEVSLVTIGMNPLATVIGVKSTDVFTRWQSGVRPQRRELETMLKDGFGVSNSEAERMANALLNEDRGGRDDADPLACDWETIRNAPIIDLTGLPD